MAEANRKVNAGPETIGDLAPAAGDIVPIGANLIATAATFVFLMVAPMLCLLLFEDIWKDDVAEDPIAAYLLLVDLERTTVQAVIGAAILVFVAVVLQVWRHHRPFPAYRPVLVALLVGWVWVIPEAVAWGGSVVSGAVIGSVLAVAFAIQWGLTLSLDRVLD